MRRGSYVRINESSFYDAKEIKIIRRRGYVRITESYV
jgi:hypothetical protein